MNCQTRKFCLIAAMLCTLPSLSFAQSTQAASTTAANDLPSPDKAFVQAATMANSTEIDTGKMATEQSYNAKVKSYGRAMIDDHTLMMAKLKIATPHGVATPKDNSDIALINSLKPLRGDAFDRAYMHEVGLHAHRQAIEAFEKEAANGKVQDLKAFAAASLPKIKAHYKMAEDLIGGKAPRPIED